MKPFRIPFLIFIFSSLSNVVLSQHAVTDTIFILKNKNQHVFVEPSAKSERYKILSDFSFADYQEESYQTQLNELVSAATEFKKMKFRQMPRKWVRCYLYKGFPYLYYPCDFIHYSAVMFTDSSFLKITGEGPEVYSLVSYHKRKDNSHYIKANGLEIIIHPVTIKGKPLAVFETYYISAEDTVRMPSYSLMTDVRNINQLPIIVNECDHQKEREFNLDETDYKKILNNSVIMINPQR